MHEIPLQTDIAREFVASVQDDFDVSTGAEWALVQTAAAALDSLTLAQQDIAENGIVDKDGKARAACGIADKAQRSFVTATRALGINQTSAPTAKQSLPRYLKGKPGPKAKGPRPKALT